MPVKMISKKWELERKPAVKGEFEKEKEIRRWVVGVFCG